MTFRKGMGDLLRLNGYLKQRFKEQIANVRHKYMHSSNQFPWENEVNALTTSFRVLASCFEFKNMIYLMWFICYRSFAL